LITPVASSLARDAWAAANCSLVGP
jgi:hypothetical protein